MTIILDGLTPKELALLISNAESKMVTARATQVETVRAKIESILKSAGLDLADVYPTRAGKGGKGHKGGKGGTRAKRAGAGVPKYHNPADQSQTWSGLGKKPHWFVAALKKRGASEESLLIAGGAAKAAPAETVKKAAGKKVAGKKIAAKKAAAK